MKRLDPTATGSASIVRLFACAACAVALVGQPLVAADSQSKLTVIRLAQAPAAEPRVLELPKASPDKKTVEADTIEVPPLAKVDDSKSVPIDDGKLPVIVPLPRRQTVQMMYDQIYRSIPYRRIEHRANPAYRHQATIEIMISRQLFPTDSRRKSVSVSPPPAARD